MREFQFCCILGMLFMMYVKYDLSTQYCREIPKAPQWREFIPIMPVERESFGNVKSKVWELYKQSGLAGQQLTLRNT